jgi:iron complex outermembrane recepter protein
MASNKTLTRAVRLALVAAAVYGTAAVAQDAEIEQIVVTGSRIAVTGLDSASPLQVISADTIDESGVANIQDLLLKNPTFGSPSISRTNSNFSTSSAGVATIDLRNLGTSRTLVLVDGRRFVAGIPGESAVDLNTIPTQFIERVDILTGGASAVYGSDAIAGVVNIIYKKNFEGVEFDGQYGISNVGDDQEKQFGMTIGTNVADGRGNIMAYLGYSDQGAVFSRDRARSRVDQYSLGAGFTGDPHDFFTPVRPFYSSFAPSGRFFRPNAAGTANTGSSYTFDANGNVVPWSTNGSATLAATGFNRSSMRTIAIPTERYLAATRGSFEFTDNQSAFLEATYASTQATTELEPFPLDSVNIYPGTGGRVPLQTAIYSADPANPGSFIRTIYNNPMVPAYVLSQARDTNGDGLKDINFTRRMTEVGNRGSTADRDTFRLVGGLEGKLFDNAWNYEAYYSYGQTKESQVSGGQVNVLNFRNALEAMPDINDVNGNGNRTEAICVDPGARKQGCVPISVFGPGSISPAAAKYIAAPSLLSTFTSQKLAGVNLSGEPFDLWAGPLAVAVGGEYREEFARSEFDALQQSGLNAGNAIPATKGGFHVAEGYGEVQLPLLKDVFLANKLDFRGAYRYSDYSTVGSTESWNLGLEWSPIPQLRFRGIRAQSVRAPNINELYSPPSQDFPTGLNDPCVGVTATSTGPTAAACRAAPGVLANINANGAFTLSQADIQGVSGYNRGNPNLNEEQGRSWTFGVVITPDGVPVLEKFGFTIDYFKIEIADAIVSTPRQFILDQCYSGSGNSSFCQFITRRPSAAGANSAGSLEFIDSAVTNSGTLGSEGIDFTLTYAQEVGPGNLNARLSYTHMLDGYVTPLPGEAKDPYNGEIGAPKDRAYLSLGYNVGMFNIVWMTTYIGASSLDDQFLAGYDLKPGSVGVGEVWYHDVQVSLKPWEHVEMYVGANNVFDQAPAKIISGLPGDNTGTETNAGTYDAIGQRFYAGMRVKF